jgi:arylsulfatase
VVQEPAHLVDVLPTFADVAGARLPEQWPGRQLTPVSGVSLAGLLAGEPLGKRPPLYFLFTTDRALRDGDWKIVSFRSNPWQLYNLANDRTELHDLAAQEPEVRDRLVKLWHDMAENVDNAPARNRGPVAAVAKPVEHPQWSNYASDGKPAAVRRQRRKAAQ